MVLSSLISWYVLQIITYSLFGNTRKMCWSIFWILIHHFCSNFWLIFSFHSISTVFHVNVLLILFLLFLPNYFVNSSVPSIPHFIPSPPSIHSITICQFNSWFIRLFTISSICPLLS